MAWMNPFEEIRRMQRDIDRMFGDFFDKSSFASFKRDETEWREPLVDVLENENSVIIKAELPGVDKNDIKLNVTKNTLEIKVEKRKEEKSETETSRRLERTYTGFYRYMRLPEEVIPEDAKANYKDGILEIKLPKREKSKVKNVEIKVQ